MFRCCQHCEDPCPAIGHTKACVDCRGNGLGRKTTDGRHYPPAVIRTWDPQAYYVTAKEYGKCEEQADRLQATAKLAHK